MEDVSLGLYWEEERERFCGGKREEEPIPDVGWGIGVIRKASGGKYHVS